MLQGTLVASTPSLPQGGNSWHKRFGGLSGSLDALSPPRIRVDLEGDVAVVRDQPNSAPLAHLRLDIGGEVQIIEGGQALARLTGQRLCRWPSTLTRIDCCSGAADCHGPRQRQTSGVQSALKSSDIRRFAHRM